MKINVIDLDDEAIELKPIYDPGIISLLGLKADTVLVLTWIPF